MGMWQPAAEDNSVLALSHPGHKGTWRSSEAALLHLLLTAGSLGVFSTSLVRKRGAECGSLGRIFRMANY